MALAFLLNPSRRRRGARSRRKLHGAALAAHRKRMARCGRRPSRRRRVKSRKRSLASKRAWARRKAGGITIGASPGDLGRGAAYTLNNPRRRRRKGGKMATKRRARRRGRAKMFRNKKGRYSRRRGRASRRVRYHSGRKRGWWNPRSRRRRKSRRRNPLAIRGGMYQPNPRRRRKSRRRNPLAIRGGMYQPNPRRRRRARRRSNTWFRNPRRGRRRGGMGRRRNPSSLGGVVSQLRRDLTNPATLMQFAAGAAGATVSEFLGTLIASKIRQYSGVAALSFGFGASLLDFATRVGAGLLAAMIVPAKFKGAFTLGAGAMAAKPFVDMLVGPALSATGLLSPVMAPATTPSGTAGIAGWISVGQSKRLGVSGMHPGLGAYISAGQARRLGMSGLGDGDAFSYGSPAATMYRYDAQPIAAMTNWNGQ